MTPTRFCLALCSLELVAGAPSAQASVFCVNTPQGLISALTTAQANGSDDDVRIVAGNYDLPVEPTYASEEAFAVEVSGGWDATCSSQDAGDTALNGQASFLALVVTQNYYFSTGPSISVHDLTLRNGFATAASGVSSRDLAP